MEQWITQELERTELGDARRTKRLIKIVENLSAKPEASVPQASGTWSETKATYDFWDSPYIKPSMIRVGHIDATVERIAQQQEVVLAIQDTTELNYTSHKALSGKGYLDSSYAQGLKVHSVFTVSAQGLPLGIIEQQVWARKEEELGKAEQRKQKSTADKESQKWLSALKATDSIIPPSVQVVTIADREADIYDLFACSRRPGSDFLIRASQNRCLDGCEPISWLLLTTLKITSLKDVQQYVRWYSYRWLIERYHYVLKSGCGIEKLQLETAQRLEMALATYSIVAGAFAVADLLSSLSA